MEPNQAVDDLKVIRQIMDRSRKAASSDWGGWIMILWGAIWLVGFSASQFLPQSAVGWVWMVLNPLGMVGTIWLALRMGRSGVASPIWRPVLLWWASLGVFDVLVVWLFGLSDTREILMLILLTIALGYVQLGLFAHWLISAVGVALAVTAVGAWLLMPGTFNLAMAVLGGGLLLASGIWFVRQGE